MKETCDKELIVARLMTGIEAIPNEILIQIFSYLSFDAMLQGRMVCRLWHWLIPKAMNSLSQILLTKYQSHSVPTDLPEYCKVTLPQRINFVDHIETNYHIRLPDLFRRILLEWPSKYPVPGHQWPETLCWYANQTCARCLSKNDQCACYHPDLVLDYDITLTESVLTAIINHQPTPMLDNDSYAWELFDNPPPINW